MHSRCSFPEYRYFHGERLCGVSPMTMVLEVDAEAPQTDELAMMGGKPWRRDDDERDKHWRKPLWLLERLRRDALEKAPWKRRKTRSTPNEGETPVAASIAASTRSAPSSTPSAPSVTASVSTYAIYGCAVLLSCGHTCLISACSTILRSNHTQCWIQSSRRRRLACLRPLHLRLQSSGGTAFVRMRSWLPPVEESPAPVGSCSDKGLQMEFPKGPAAGLSDWLWQGAFISKTAIYRAPHTEQISEALGQRGGQTDTGAELGPAQEGKLRNHARWPNT